ncbi:MAG: MATE family efflux transporter [Myxococcota bacterium]
MKAPPHLTRSSAVRAALPLVLANAAEPLAGMTDTLVIGATGDAAELAGVALGVTATNLLVYSIYFIRLSTTGLVAHAVGAGDRLQAQRVLLRAALLASSLGVLGLVLGPLLANAALEVLGASPKGAVPARAYFLARTLGHPFGFSLFALSGWLIAHGRTRAVLAQQLVFSGTNIVLDLVFVLGGHQGAAGVATATALAQGAATVFGAGLVLRSLREQGGWDPRVWDRRALFEAKAWRNLAAVNFDFVVRTWGLLAGFTWFTRVGAQAGDVTVAANHVLLQIISFWAFVLDAYANVVEAAVGRAFGARSLPLFRRAVRITGELSLVSGAVFAALTLLGGPHFLEAVIREPEVAAAARSWLPWCAVVPLLGAPAWLLDGVFVGATASRAMRNASVASVVIYIAVDTGLRGVLGPDGIWPALLGYYIARGATLAVAYPRLEASVGAVAT